MRRLAPFLALLAAAAANTEGAAAAPPRVEDVAQTYARMAEAGYEDALKAAEALNEAVRAFLADPTEPRLAAARDAWRAARVPYMQTEAFRFGNRIVEDWEGRVNAWPLDEGFIDYVAGSYGTESEENEFYAANIIANPSLKIGGGKIDASNITKELLRSLHEAGGIEANVATGYHAIEFLLWGQDLNGTGEGAGTRPASDYALQNCTGGHCGRRRAYLETVTELLTADLAWMVAQWRPGGAARQALVKDGDKGVLIAILTGLGSLSYGELAGERMRVGLLVHDPEEEQDCFSDNTPYAHYYNVLGIRNVYLGTYRRLDGTSVEGASVSDLVRAKAPAVDQAVRAALTEAMARVETLVARFKKGEAYDQMLAEGNQEGNAAIEAAIGALQTETQALEQAVAVLDLKPIQFKQPGGGDGAGTPAQESGKTFR